MHLVIKEDGNVVNVIESHPVTREDLVAIVDKAKAYVAEAEHDLQKFDDLRKVEEAAEVPEPTPVEQPAPVADQPIEVVETPPVATPQPEAPIASQPDIIVQ